MLQFASGAMLQVFKAVIEAGDVAHVLWPFLAWQRKFGADVLLHRLLACGAGKLQAQHCLGVVHLDLVADQNAVFQAMVFGDSDAAHFQLDGVTQRADALQMAVEKLMARFEHLFIGGKTQHGFKQ